MKRTHRLRLITVLLLAATSVGCGKKDPDSPFRRRLDTPVRVTVDNNNFLDVTVYAVAGGVSIRLGDVTGKSEESFTIDPRRASMIAGLQLMVDPLGSNRSYLSPLVYPGRGETVLLSVGANLDQSFVTLR